MPVPALRLEQPTFREGIAHYVTTKCRRYRVSRVDVDDLIQEALINILAKLTTFQAEKSDFEQWARGIAWNVIREHLRKTKLYRAFFTEYHPNVHDYPSHEHSPERCARRNQAGCAIVNAAESISTQQVQVLALHVVDDMSHKEIALELDISVTTSQKDYQRARNHLARCISREAFSVMPPHVAGCNDSVSFDKTDSRWSERSHYTGQVAAAILAFLSFVPSNQTPQMHASMTGDARVLAPIKIAVMHQSDERKVIHDAPNGKLDPAQMTSVRAVSTPTKVVDKLPPPPEYVPRLSHKHEPSTSDHRPNGR